MGIRGQQLGRILWRIRRWLRRWRWLLGRRRGWMVIESTRNPRVKAWLLLRNRKERDRTGTFIIEGHREAVRAAEHLEIVESIIREDQTTDGLPSPTLVSTRVFGRISARQNPDGIAVVARTPPMDLSAMEAPPSDVHLIGDGIEKPGNVGAMLRTADAFGTAFVGSALASDLVNPNTVRAAQGSLFSTPIAVAPRDEAVAWAANNTTVIVADPDGETGLWDADLSKGPLSLVIGSEHAGVDPAWLSVGTAVSIPVRGAADSLNASVAAALFVAEAIRQRR